MSNFNFNDSSNLEYLDQQYELWEKDYRLVDPSLNGLFTGLAYNGHNGKQFRSNGNGHAEFQLAPASQSVNSRLQTAAVRLMNAYRDLGHLLAKTDPLAAPGEEPPRPFLLELERFNLKPEDLDQVVDASMLYGIDESLPIRDIIEFLEETYCGSTGIEYMHIQEYHRRRWLAQRIEPTRNKTQFTGAEKYRILMTLKHAQMFEDFLQTKYVGHKRFGLEGGESLIPMLDAIVELAPSLGAKEIVIGMAHRGRLNVLCNILEKPYQELFNEFEDRYDPNLIDGDGDVKYHLGFSADINTHNGGHVHLTMAPNPSHLECVFPVVVGRVRAKQRIHNDEQRKAGIPLVIHGDAAFSGQGVVPETLNMANLMGYRTGGVIHIVVNNQIGFTTHPRDARSTEYCSDIAKFIQAPIFHVNADDPEACVRTARLAFEYRQEFSSDVVIDMVCYRKLGHNETDEPSFTQPVEYQKIAKKSRIATIYAEKLVARGDIGASTAEAIDKQFDTNLDAAVHEFNEQLKEAYKAVKDNPPQKKGMKGYAGTWSSLQKTYSHESVDTAISEEMAHRIAHQLVNLPEGFVTHPKLSDKIPDGKGGMRYPSGDTPYRRRDEILAGGTVDWGTGESLAYGSLLLEGHSVRLSGQDSRRGTFSHRHAVYFDQNTGKPFCPLAHLASGSAAFDVYDSHLSEMAVLGFEYGYSLDSPNTLTIWEAQFGDFVNGAQVIIDQFIVSAETKWNRSSGLVMLLPHGHEGAGPEHSSARPERFLQLCAEDNIIVCNFTTPAQIFHALRRQLKQDFRKPLIVMTPKSLLRHPLAGSPVSEFTQGRFQEVIDDATADASQVKRVVMCSGKVYYDALAARNEGKAMVDPKTEYAKLENPNAVALVRLEQFYPYPEQQLKAVLNRYPKAERVWLQEEPRNMGGWQFVSDWFGEMGIEVKRICRTPRASPAVGSKKVHDWEQAELVAAVFNKPAHYEVES